MPVPVPVPLDFSGIWTALNTAGIVVMVFYAGQLKGEFSTRIKNLEESSLARTNQAEKIAVIDTKIDNLQKDHEKLSADVKAIREGWDEFRTSVLMKKFAERC